MKTREQLYSYLIQPSHLFLKQVVKIIEVGAYLLIVDLRKSKNLFIHQLILEAFEERINEIRNMAYKSNEYEGDFYVLLAK